MAGEPNQQAVPEAQFPQSNAAQKVNLGGQPDPLASALNAFLTQMSGTNYNMNQAATSYAPPRQPGGIMPGGMMIGTGQMPPMPTPNPSFHPGSPLEYDLGAMLRGSMMPTGQPSTFIPSNMIATGDDNATIPSGGGDPNAKAKDAMPSKKPKKVAPKKPGDDKPKPYQGKGNPPKDEPKQKTPPPRKKMIAGK